MAYLHDETDDDPLDHPRERELTLSTGTVLGIFFGLALLCGAFFAFGFNMGSKARPTVTAAAEGPGPAADFGRFKPSSGAPAIQPVPGYLSPKEADAANKVAANTAYNAPGASAAASTGPPPAAAPHPATSFTATRDLDLSPQPTQPAPIVRTAPAPARLPAPAAEPLAPGSFMVQVAAVTHPEDADLLIGALKRRGYSVAARSEPQDRLVHVQVGPFGSKKDAEAMRQRLLADGYNAIVK